ncbi:MAG: NAD(P)/FAD-dependent oxidoreductase [Bacteroidales bacterium]|nr:NAD(P)/FAD-dependent oxidoreductase [Bacteroidales bacterium]
MSQKYDTIIIGGGLSGLLCGYLLSKKGQKTLVLEQDMLLGGCLQSFKRHGQTFDTGFHYVGGLEEGQLLNHLFKYFHLMDLPWKKMDKHFDEIFIGEQHYSFVTGYDDFAKQMSAYFPNKANQFQQYVNILKDIHTSTIERLQTMQQADITSDQWFNTSAYDYLKSTFEDDHIVDVLAGTSLKMDLDKKMPLYVFAHINGSFIESAWRIIGGGMQVADSLANDIRKMGGEVMTKMSVAHLHFENGYIQYVQTENGEIFHANHIISSLHPQATFHLIDSENFARKTYIWRMNHLENSTGMFTANILLKDNAIPYQNRNLHIHQEGNLWQTRYGKDMLISFTTDKEDAVYTKNIDILTPMSWEYVAAFVGTHRNSRPEKYLQLKQHTADFLIDRAENYIPDLKEQVEQVYTSTPLTYQEYTSTPNGSAYGVKKQYDNVLTTFLTPKTAVKNLYLTGQSLNLHGILGTTITSLYTCAEILGANTIAEEVFGRQNPKNFH